MKYFHPSCYCTVYVWLSFALICIILTPTVISISISSWNVHIRRPLRNFAAVTCRGWLTLKCAKSPSE